MEVKLKFDSWDRIVSSVCIQSMNIPLSIIVCCSPIVLCRLFSIISCFRTINHLWYIYIYIKEKKRNIIKKQKMEWDMYFSISVIFFYSKLFYFIRCTTISYVTCIFMIIELYIFLSLLFFFYLSFIRLISNQLNNLFFFLLIILDPISLLNSITPLLSLASVLQIRRSSPPLFSTF